MKFLKYHLSKILSILLLLSLLILPNKVYAIEEQTSRFYVNDYANVLSQDLEDHIMKNSVALYNANKTQIVVSVVNSLEGLTIEEYALKMFRNFGIGDKEKNNGILLLLSIEDREIRIEVGYGLEGAINDGKAGRIIDNYMIPYLSVDNWEDGIKCGYDAIFAEIVHEYGLELDYNKSYLESGNTIMNNRNIYVLCILIAIFNIFFGIVLRKKKLKKIADTYILILTFITFGGAIIGSLTKVEGMVHVSLFAMFELFVFTFSYIPLNKNNVSFSWSSSGRSSSGGGGFSGGGGSSGGGGASRRF